MIAESSHRAGVSLRGDNHFKNVMFQTFDRERSWRDRVKGRGCDTIHFNVRSQHAFVGYRDPFFRTGSEFRLAGKGSLYQHVGKSQRHW